MKEIKNVEAEQCVLGALIIDCKEMGKLQPYLKANHFTDKLHRVIYQAMWTQYNKGKYFDLLTLGAYFPNYPEAKAVLTSAASSVPTSVNVEYYARIVEGCAVRNHLRNYAEQIIRDTEDENMTIDDALTRAKMMINRVCDRK